MDVEKLIEQEQNIRFAAPCKVTVGKKTYSVKQVSNAVSTRIHRLNMEALYLEKQAKGEISLKKANRISDKLRTLHSKTAAYYLLNNKAIFLPLLFWLTWKRIDMKSSEHSFRINEAGASNKGYAFFLQNWQITKAQLALTTNLVGNSVKESAERKESAANMLDEDALPKKQEADK
jgi:hypothetical protein